MKPIKPDPMIVYLSETIVPMAGHNDPYYESWCRGYLNVCRYGDIRIAKYLEQIMRALIHSAQEQLCYESFTSNSKNRSDQNQSPIPTDSDS